MIDTSDPVAVRAEAERRSCLRANGIRRFDAPDPAPPARELSPRDAIILEKQIEAEGDRLMQQLGFEVIRFSHPGKTQQTPGIPDRRYYRRPRDTPASVTYRSQPIVVWVEYKSANGRQRPGQKLFQELVTACGEHYVLGGINELKSWLERTL